MPVTLTTINIWHQVRNELSDIINECQFDEYFHKGPLHQNITDGTHTKSPEIHPANEQNTHTKGTTVFKW